MQHQELKTPSIYMKEAMTPSQQKTTQEASTLQDFNCELKTF
jgi:hypothetical protein